MHLPISTQSGGQSPDSNRQSPLPSPAGYHGNNEAQRMPATLDSHQPQSAFMAPVDSGYVHGASQGLSNGHAGVGVQALAADSFYYSRQMYG